MWENFLFCLVHQRISSQEVVKIPETKAAVDIEYWNLKRLLAWDEKKVKSKDEGTHQAKKHGRWTSAT